MVNEGYNSYIGKQIKSYTILHKLGNGGFACVYLARNDLNELVAIKLLNPKYNKSEGRQLFLQEAQFLQELKHQQYILPILDYGENENTPYIIVEYTPGGTLRERINNCRPIAIDDALTILMQVGEAIHIAHQHRIVHSDLKPENILFNARNEALLADFGLATSLSTASFKHVDSAGTPRYMAPEQFHGNVSKESDQYCLACIAYELVTGRPPFIEKDSYQFTMIAPGGPLSFIICDNSRSDDHDYLSVTVTGSASSSSVTRVSSTSDMQMEVISTDILAEEDKKN